MTHIVQMSNGTLDTHRFEGIRGLQLPTFYSDDCAEYKMYVPCGWNTISDNSVQTYKLFLKMKEYPQ